MLEPLTILIRTSNRPELFARCVESVNNQSIPVNVIVAYDNEAALQYIPAGIKTIRVTPQPEFPFFYDLYCNDLMQSVNEGWFLFLDDDDFFIDSSVVKRLSEYLTDPDRPVICQFLRHGRPKPNKHEIINGVVIEGKIGLPCIVLHSKHKDLARLDGKKSGDYRFIKTISEQLKCQFIELVTVGTDRRSFGRMEEVCFK